MRSEIKLFDDQFKFCQELKSKKLLRAFVDYMFNDAEPEGLNGIEKVAFESLRKRMEKSKKIYDGNSKGGQTSHGGGRPSKTSSELTSKNKSKTTHKQVDDVKQNNEEEDILSNDNILEDKRKKKKLFDEFRKQFPHARQGKKQETYEQFLKQDSEYVMFRMHHLKRLIKAGAKNPEYIQACQRRVRDLTPLSEEILNIELKQILSWHLKTEGAKDRYPELAKLYGEEKIKTLVKSLQSNLSLITH